MVKTRQYSFVWSPEEKLNMTDENSGTWDKWRDLNKLCHVWNKMEPISKSTSIIFMTKKVAVDMMNEKEDHERNFIEKCTKRDDWPN